MEHVLVSLGSEAGDLLWRRIRVPVLSLKHCWATEPSTALSSIGHRRPHFILTLVLPRTLLQKARVAAPSHTA